SQTPEPVRWWRKNTNSGLDTAINPLGGIDVLSYPRIPHRILPHLRPRTLPVVLVRTDRCHIHLLLRRPSLQTRLPRSWRISRRPQLRARNDSGLLLRSNRVPCISNSTATRVYSSRTPNRGGLVDQRVS